LIQLISVLNAIECLLVDFIEIEIYLIRALALLKTESIADDK